jgi:hypothetical protein
LDQGTEVNLNLGPTPSTSTGTFTTPSASFLTTLNGFSTHRSSSPGGQSRVSNSDISDNESLLERSACILPGLQNIDDDTDSQDTNESSSLNLCEILLKQELEKVEQRKRQEEEDRKFALKLEREEKRGSLPKPDYKLRPKSKPEDNNKGDADQGKDKK